MNIISMIHTLPQDIQRMIYTQLTPKHRVRLFLALPKECGKNLFNKDKDNRLRIVKKFFKRHGENIISSWVGGLGVLSCHA